MKWLFNEPPTDARRPDELDPISGWLGEPIHGAPAFAREAGLHRQTAAFHAKRHSCFSSKAAIPGVLGPPAAETPAFTRREQAAS
jgi:hypothetical protein